MSGDEKPCLATLVEYAREQALLPVPVAGAGPEWEACWSAARARAARIWLLLPVLIQARTGELPADWRGRVRAATRTEAAASVEVAAAVLELGEMPRQVWEPDANVGVRMAADAWYQAVSVMLLEVWSLVFYGEQQHRTDRDNPWYSETVPAACQAAAWVVALAHRAALTQGEPPGVAGTAAEDRRLIEAPLPWFWCYRPSPRRRITPDPDEVEQVRAEVLAQANIDASDALLMATRFARSMATLTPHPGRYQVAEAALLLPALWQARTGTLDPQWRTSGTINVAGECSDPDRSCDLQAAAIALAELPTQPWETGAGPEALDAWFAAARRAAYTIYEHVGRAYAAQLFSAASHEPARRACYALIVLTEASYLAAGGGDFPLHRLAPRQPDAPNRPDELSAADEAAVFTPAPAAWAPPAGQMDARILASVTAQVGASANVFAAQRLLLW